MYKTGLNSHLYFLTPGHSDAQPWASACPDVKNFKWRLSPIWHRMLFICTHVATVGVKGLNHRCTYINILLDTVLSNAIKAKSCNHMHFQPCWTAEYSKLIRLRNTQSYSISRINVSNQSWVCSILTMITRYTRSRACIGEVYGGEMAMVKLCYRILSW